jgi:hypothetical protein
MSYFVTFGASQVEPIWVLLDLILARVKRSSIEVLPASHGGSYACQLVSYSWEAAKLRLLSRELIAVHVILEQSIGSNYMIHAPHRESSQSTQWVCTGEGSRDAMWAVYLASKKTCGVEFTSFSVDDSSDFSELERVSVDNYPWGEWCLIRGAVRRPDGEWEERTGTGPAAEADERNRSKR